MCKVNDYNDPLSTGIKKMLIKFIKKIVIILAIDSGFERTGYAILKSDKSVVSYKTSPDVKAVRREIEDAVQRALGNLPEDYRRVLRLRYEENRSFEEIGDLLQCTANAARKLWMRAIKRLQKETQEFQS